MPAQAAENFSADCSVSFTSIFRSFNASTLVNISFSTPLR